MTKTNPDNERIKRAYFVYLREARRASEATIDGVAKAIACFEDSTSRKAFRSFHREQAVAFKRRLIEQRAVRSGEKLSRATVNSTLSALRTFFLWLADQQGYKRRIAYSDADYFNLPEKDVRIAKAVRPKRVPTLEQVHHVLSLMPARTDIELRDRALIAFAALTGARDGALATFQLRHLDLAEAVVHQDARQVKTKFSKTFSTWFFPVGADALEIVTGWEAHLRSLHWGDADPLFPATRVEVGADGGFVAAGLDRRPWSTAEPIRRIFREAFAVAGLPYFNPHSFRDMLALLGERICTTPEEFKAWSQNFGHEHVLTTFTSYGAVPVSRQAELIRGLGRSADGASNDDLAADLEALLAKRRRV
ncbi:site-specific integrase [Phenylobacterium sp.]|uniref:site-specific integrase n=1 Tax=Phenylobacterium sp. TaxID=1871053 RepID=UPI003D295E58